MRDCKHGQLARSCDRCADEAEIAELRLSVELLAKCAMAAHEALKCRDRYGWSVEADAALELLRAIVPPMPFVVAEHSNELRARVNQLTLYAAGVEAERDKLSAELSAEREHMAELEARVLELADRVERLTTDRNSRTEDAVDLLMRERGRCIRLESALELIAAPMRPDGTWNRDREACRQLAQEALGK